MTIGMLVANIPVQISNSSFLLCSKFLPQCRQYWQSAALGFPQEGHRAIWQSGARQNPEFEGRVIRDLGLRIGKYLSLYGMERARMTKKVMSCDPTRSGPGKQFSERLDGSGTRSKD